MLSKYLQFLENKIDFIYLLLLLLLTAFIITYSLIPIFIKLSLKFKIIDQPNQRKVHTDFKPTMGGLLIILGTFISILTWVSWKELVLIRVEFIATLCMIIVGIRDDFINLKPYQKLLVQIFAAELVTYFNSLALFSFSPDIHDSLMIKVFLNLITLFFIIGLTNAVNLIDGIDGLATSYIILIFSFLAIWFFIEQSYIYSFCLIPFIGALIAFLFFNWQPSKIFMGDTGSLTLGFILSLAVLQFIKSNIAPNVNLMFKFNNIYSIFIGLIYLPLVDTLRIMSVRLLNNKSPFKPDKNHIHHVFTRLGLSHKQTTSILFLINFFLIITLCTLRKYNEIYSLIYLSIFTSIFLYFLYEKYKLKKILRKLHLIN